MSRLLSFPLYLRAGQHSIRINSQWRIAFTWTGTDAAAVEICDYH